MNATRAKSLMLSTRSILRQLVAFFGIAVIVVASDVKYFSIGERRKVSTKRYKLYVF